MDDAARDQDDALSVVRELRTFVNSVERYMAEMSHLHTMHRTDLTALSLIMEGKASSPKELSDVLALSPPATSAMLTRLEQAGHIERSQLPLDRRAVHIEMTESARSVGVSMFGVLARHMHPVLEAADPADLRTFAALLEQLHRCHRCRQGRGVRRVTGMASQDGCRARPRTPRVT
ncbi:MarR family winged helix-turn-helix transcriptional regulator [Aeromicrobium sp. UC242_57]|uniref:MarR family winged helix-turn-helix transcriptional regulator n=1 Tax=Aeromicrobium sp. UC242_57 TaxID=3374624 RepID=UPI0037A6E0BA